MYGYCYISFSFQVYITKLTYRVYIAQAAGAVEYTDCSSAEE